MNELTNESPYELGKDMKFIEDIDHGAFGTVIHALELLTNQDFAVKVINKTGAGPILIKKMKEEVAILKQLQHENIVKFYGCKETNTQLLIKMEYIKYGTLSHWIKDHHKISEYDASIIIKKVLSAVEYLHSKQICHRDIKPENIMISKENDLNSIKIIDFGLSVQHFNYLSHNDYCGTFIYMAPEQIEKKLYFFSVDIWSIGILMYMLLNNGKHPFYQKNDNKQDFINKIKSGKIFFINKLSFMAKNLIMKLCDPNPSHRYSACLAEKHPWITRNVNDPIPMTFNDVLNKNNNKKNATTLIMINVFLNYYKKKETMKKIKKDKENSNVFVFKKKNKCKFFKINEIYINQCNIISKQKRDKINSLKEKCLEVLSTDEEESFEKKDKFSSKKNNKSCEKYVTPVKKTFANDENKENSLLFDLKKNQVVKRLSYKKKFKFAGVNNRSPDNIIETKPKNSRNFPDIKADEQLIKKTKTIKTTKLNDIINKENKIERNNSGSKSNSKSKMTTKYYVKNFQNNNKIMEPTRKISELSNIKGNNSNKYYLKTNLPCVTSSKKNTTIKYKPIEEHIEKYNIVPLVLPFIGPKQEERKNKMI